MAESIPLLQGLHVVDIASWIAGPAATTILSDFGADVIKVEPPGVGDTYRYFSHMPPNPVIEGVNYTWQLTNRNKRSLDLNLKSPAARSVVECLVKWADVLVTNFPPPARAKLGLDYEMLAPLNPRLIYADITGFGEAGPEAGEPGFDLTAFWARSGLMDMTRFRNEPPPMSVFGSGDHPTATSLYAGIMTALYRREKTGQGARVSASLIGQGAWAAGCTMQAVLYGAKQPQLIDRLAPPNALASVYRTADDRWIVLALANEDKLFPFLLDALGHPEAATDSRFKDSASRHSHATEIAGLLDTEFAKRPLSEWRELFDARGLTYGVVQTLEEMAHDPQLVANNILVPIDDGSEQPHLTIDSPVHLDQERKVRPRRAPELGEHTDTVLAELGFNASAIANLRAAGAISHNTQQRKAS